MAREEAVEDEGVVGEGEVLRLLVVADRVVELRGGMTRRWLRGRCLLLCLCTLSRPSRPRTVVRGEGPVGGVPVIVVVGTTTTRALLKPRPLVTDAVLLLAEELR